MKELQDHLEKAEDLIPQQVQHLRWLALDRCQHFVHQHAAEVREQFSRLPPALYKRTEPDLLRAIAGLMAADSLLALAESSKNPENSKALDEISQQLSKQGYDVLFSIANGEVEGFYDKADFYRRFNEKKQDLLELWQESTDHEHKNFFRPGTQTLNQKLGLLLDAQMDGVQRVSIYGPSKLERCFRFDQAHDSSCPRETWVTPLQYLQWLVEKNAEHTVAQLQGVLPEHTPGAILPEQAAGENFNATGTQLEALIALQLAEKFREIFKGSPPFDEWLQTLQEQSGGLKLDNAQLQRIRAAGSDRSPPPPQNPCL